MIWTFLILCVPLVVFGYATWVSIRRGINFADEGYMVYGVQALLRGETPIRDFRAYDPGRYLWFALWAAFLGPGFLAVRAAMAAMAAAGVCFATWIAFDASGNAVLAALLGTLVVFCIYPRVKQIEISFCLFIFAVNYQIIGGGGNPAFLGAFGAVCALFGLNLVVYFIGSSILAFALAMVSQGLGSLSGVPTFVGGFLLSLLPFVIIAGLIPNFCKSYLERKVLPLFRRGTTNLPLPRPWIWSNRPLYGASNIPAIVLKTLFTFSPFVYLLVIFLVLTVPDARNRADINLVLAACSTGIVFFHYAFSRADLVHLVPALQPFIIMLGAVSVAFLPVSAAGLVLLLPLAGSILLLRGIGVLGQTWMPFRRRLQPMATKTERLLVARHVADRVASIQLVVESASSENDPLFVAPHLPGLLALFNRRTAVYDTFPVYPATKKAQDDMLDELKASKPPVAIISNRNLDGRDDLRFEKNYPIVFSYVEKNYSLRLENDTYKAFLINTWK